MSAAAGLVHAAVVVAALHGVGAVTDARRSKPWAALASRLWVAWFPGLVAPVVGGHEMWVRVALAVAVVAGAATTVVLTTRRTGHTAIDYFLISAPFAAHTALAVVSAALDASSPWLFWLPTAGSVVAWGAVLVL